MKNKKYKLNKQNSKMKGVHRHKADLIETLAENDIDISKLTLKSIKSPSAIFLGRLKLGSNPNIHYNVRIDYYKRGHRPILEIKI